DRLAFLAADLLDGPRILGLDGHLHLHRLEYHQRVALVDRLAELALDLPDRSGDVRFDVGHGLARYPAVSADLAVIVTARNEADRLGATLRALREAFPGAGLWVADDAS